MVTLWLYQPLAFGAVVAAALMVGLVRSMLIPLTVPGVATLPATSAQLPVPVTDWFAPSLLKVAPARVLLPTPEEKLPSLQPKLTVTALLFQPAPLGPGFLVREMSGAKGSIFSV